MLKTSAYGRKKITEFEGCVLKAYYDSVGVITIGVGHTSMAGPPVVKPGMRITAAEADEILSRDLAKFEAAVNRLVKVELNQNQFDSLVSFTFNLGEGNLSKSTLLKRINARDFEGAADEFHKWNRAGGRVLAGLTKRRAAEAALFLTPGATVVTAPPKVTAPATSGGLLAAILALFRKGA